MPSTVLITGASSGIGYAMAEVVAALGYDLVLVARDKEKLESLRKHLRNAARCTVIAADLCEPQMPEKIFRTTERAGIQVDILINNAGSGKKGGFTASLPAAATNQVSLNTRALTSLCHYYGSEMAKRGAGKILNVSSIAGFTPAAYMAVYAATKAYVQSFSEGLHEELAPRGVQVSVLCPGPTLTDFNKMAGAAEPLQNTPWFAPVATPEAVAKYAIRKLNSGKTVIIPGFMNRLMVFALRFFPRSLARYLVCRSEKPIH